MKEIILFVSLILMVTYVGVAQTGPGGVGDNTTNKLWLRASDVSGNIGDPVTAWADTSGNSNGFEQSDAAHQPTLELQDGMKVVRFDSDGSNFSTYDYMGADASFTPYVGKTAVIVFRVDPNLQDVGDLGHIWGKYDDGVQVAADPRAARETYGFSFDGDNNPTNSAIYGMNGADFTASPQRDDNEQTWSYGEFEMVTVQYTEDRTLSDHLLADCEAGNTNFYGGDIAEVIIYNTTLNTAQRRIVENYLAAKFGLTLENESLFAYSESYGNNVIGIGQEIAGVSHSESSCSLLAIKENTAFDDGDYLLIGHDGNSVDSWSNTNTPFGGINIQRIERSWRATDTNGVGGIDLTLDTTLFTARPAGYSKFVLMIAPADDGGDFSNASVYELVSAGDNNLFATTNVTIGNGNYISFATVKPTAQFSLSESRGFEDAACEIEISINVALSSDVDVEITTADGGGSGDDAIQPGDYTSRTNFTVTIPAGSQTINGTIPIIADGTPENDESFSVILTSSDPDITVEGNTTHVYTINDIDNATNKINFSLASSPDEPEANTTVDIDVVSTIAAGTVQYRIAGGTATSGSDYNALSGTLDFTGGTTQQISLDILNDGIPESNETVIIELYNPINANLDAVNPIQHTVTIDDSGEAQREVAFLTDSVFNSENVTPYNVQLGLTGISGIDVEVSYSLSGNGVFGVDHNLTDGTFIIPAGSTSYNLELPIINDDIEEQQDTIVITLDGAVNADLGTITKFYYFIENDDFGYIGPGGVGSAVAIKQWLRADKNITKDGSDKISAWGDESGNGYRVSQSVADEQPTYVDNVINGQPAVLFATTPQSSPTLGESLRWDTTPGNGYQAQEVFAVVQTSITAINDDNLGQIWGSYGDGFHVALEARSARGQNGFSFDGQEPLNIGEARYSLNENDFTVSYYDNTLNDADQQKWSDDTPTLIDAEFKNVNLLERNSIGRLETGGDNWWYGGYIAEVIAYASSVDSADRLIIKNYLAAKYGINIGAKDLYAHEAAYGFDVSGIGQADVDNYHHAAQSAKMLKISEASDLGDGEFALFGHNNLDTLWTAANVPASGYQRISRIWQFDQNDSDIGTLTIDVDASAFDAIPVSATRLILLVNNSSDFSTVAKEYILTDLGSDQYQVKNVTIPEDAYVTVACKTPTLSFGNDLITDSESDVDQVSSITVSLSEVSTVDVTFQFNVTGSTATDPDDYEVDAATPVLTDITIAAGNASATIDLIIKGDDVSEASENVQLEITSVTNAELGDFPSATFYILDDDGLESEGPAGIGNLTDQVNVWFNAMFAGDLTDNSVVSTVPSIWPNITDNNSLDAYQDEVGHEPTYYSTSLNWNQRPLIDFSRPDDQFLKIPNNSFMNTSNTAQTQRSILVVFRPSSDVLNRQVVFEEGGTVRGLNIYIENGNIYLGAWNDNDQGGTITPMPFEASSAAIEGNKPYFALLEFDYVDQFNSEVRGTVNGTALSDYSGNGAALYKHSGNIGLGGMHNGSCFLGPDCDGGDNYFFDGYIAEFVSTQVIYNDAQKHILYNYLSTKYGINISTPDYYDYDVDYGYELFGIGQVDVDNNHIAAKGTGIVKIENPTGLGDNEFMLIGRDTNVMDSWVRENVPNSDSNIYRVERTWRVDETGDLGSITLRVDTTLFDSRPSETVNYCLIKDADGDFTSGATVQLISGEDAESIYLSGVDFNAGDYFTIGCIRPAIDFFVAEGEGEEENETITVELHLNVSLPYDVSVDYAFSSSAATNPDDYIGIDNTHTITAGNLSGTFTFDVVEDGLGEINEQVLITLSNTNPSSVAIGYDTTYTYTIIDEDLTQKVNFGQQVRSGDEDIVTGNDTVFVVLTTDASGGGVSVDLEILETSTANGDGVDYNLLETQTLNFADGEDSVQVVFDIIDDLLDEPNETIEMRLTNPQGLVNMGDTTVFTYTIIDNDAEPTISFATAVASGAESITPVDVFVQLSAASGQDVTVDFVIGAATTATVGEDFYFNRTSVTIPAGETEIAYLLDIINDPAYETTNYNVVLEIDAVTNASENGDQTYTYTIIDDDFGGWEGPGGIGDLSYQIGCWLRSTQVYNIANGSEVGLQGSTEMWEDQSDNGNDAYRKTTNEAPIFFDDDATWNKRPVLRFKQFDNEILEIADNDEMNTPSGAQTQRTLVVVFRPADDVTSRQVLFEEGGGVRGLNIYIENGEILIGGYNLNANDEPDWGDTYWSYVPTRFDIEPNTPYFAILQFDFDGTDGAVRAALNGSDFQDVVGAKKLYSHPGDIGIGGVNGGAKGVGDVNLGNSYYDGYFAEFISGNFVYNNAQLKILQNYLAAKYNIDITNADDPDLDSKDIYEFGNDYGWEVVGIGQEHEDTTHNKAQGQGVILMYSPSSLSNGDYLLLGHDAGFVDDPDNSASIEEWVSSSFIDVPNNDTNMIRIRQEWRINEIGDVGTINLDVDFRNNGETGRFDNKDPEFDKYVMMVNSTSSDFITNTEVWELFPTNTVGHDVGYYKLQDYNFNHGDYFTIGLANAGVGFTDTAYEATETDADLQFQVEVKLNMKCYQQTQVDYKIVSTDPVSAEAADYAGTTTTGTLTFNAWDDSELIDITVVGDDIDENDEAFYIVLENPTNSAVLTQDTIRFIIHDDDTESKIDFSLASANVTETNFGGDFTYSGLDVVRSVSTAGAASVDYVIFSGTTTATETDDYILSNGTINFGDGDSNITLNIDIVGDDIDEDDETLTLRLTNPVSCALGTVTEFILTIDDNDNVPEIQFTTTAGNGAESVSPVSIEVSLSSISGKDISIDYTVTDGDGNTVDDIDDAENGGIDYNLFTPGTLVISAGETVGYLKPDIFNDLIPSNDKNFSITLDATPTNATTGVNDTYIYTINDDDELGYIGPGGIGDERQYVSWLRAEDETEGDGNAVNTFNDQSGNGNDAVKNTSVAAPVLRSSVAGLNNLPALEYAGSELLQINKDVQIDNSGFSEKSIVLVFDVTDVSNANPQILYEQGGYRNGNIVGYAIYIHNSRIYFSAYNNSDWGYTEISTPITNGSHYVVMVFEEGVGINATLDGVELTPSAVLNSGLKLPSHRDIFGNGLGAMRDGMVIDLDHDGTIVAGTERVAGNGYYFTGYIAEYLQYNFALVEPYRIIIENHLASKYNISIPGPSDKFDYTLADGGDFYGNHVTGIAQIAGESHIKAQGTGVILLERPVGLDDGDYLLVGDNGLGTTWEDASGIAGDGESDGGSDFFEEVAHFADKAWRVTKKGTGLESLTIGIDLSDFEAIPAEYPTYVIVVDNDNDLLNDESALSIHALEAPVGNILRDTVTISDGDVIRIGVAKNRSRVSGYWNDPATWLTGKVPTSTETAYISSGQTVTIAGINEVPTTRVDGIEIEPGGILNINETTVVYGHVNNEGTVYLDANKQIYTYSVDINNSGTFSCGDNSLFRYFAQGTTQIIPNLNYSRLYVNAGNYEINEDLNMYHFYQYNDAIVTVTGSQTITLTGEWYSSGDNTVFNPSNSTVRMIGSSRVSIWPSINLHTLEVDKDPSIWNRMILRSDLNVENLILTRGYINAYNNNLNITSDNSNAIVFPADSSSYIAITGTGRLNRRVNNGLSYTYPVGGSSGDAYFTIGMNDGSDNSTTTIGVSVTESNYPLLTSGSYISKYWTVEPLNETASIDYDVTYTYKQNEVNGSESALMPIKYSGATVQRGEPGVDFTLNTTTNTFTWTGLNSFSEFTGGDYESLPVELITFEATVKNNAVVLNWSTASELNNDYFEVERSVDGIYFETIGYVSGSGNSSLQIDYNFTDYDPILGLAYYRLRQVDYDGAFEYSPIKSVSFELKGMVEDNYIMVYPNPASDQLNIAVKGMIETGVVRLISQRGEIVKVIELEKQNIITFDVEELPQGLYILNMILNNKVTTRVISIQ